MAYINPTAVLDVALAVLTSNADQIDICSQEPTTYAEATTTYTLGNSAVTTGAAGAGSPSGRAVQVGAVASGSVTGTASATHWALTDGTSVLYATGPLTSPQSVTSGNTFTLDAIDITLLSAATA